MARILELPFPPSINHYWKRTPKGMYISKEGVLFRRRVIANLHNTIAPIASRVRVDIDLYPPDKRPFDIDNRVKATLDALTHAKVWIDDSQVDVLIVARCEQVSGGKCIVTIAELN